MSDSEICPDADDTLRNAAGCQDSFVENSINLSLLDPSRWGWTAAGGIADVLTPHEVSSVP